MRSIRLRNRQQKRGAFGTSFIAVFSLVLLRYLYFGAAYYPQLNDYNSLWILKNPVLLLLVSCAIHALAVMQFQMLFESLFGTSWLFSVVFALLPLGIEGTYILSNSLYIVSGLLCASLSAACFYDFLENGGKGNTILSFVFQMVSFWLNLQAAALSVALNLMLAIILSKGNGKRSILGLNCVFTIAFYFLISSVSGYYSFFDYATRACIYESHPLSAFMDGGYYTVVYGFIRGIMRIISDGAWLYCIITFLACVIFGLLVARLQKQGRGKIIIPAIVGIILILVPLVPLLLGNELYIPFNATVMSLIGIALIIDALFRLVSQNNRNISAVVCASVALVFCICSVSEVADYKATYESDMRIVNAISKISDEHSGESRIAILNLDPCYVSEQNIHYCEHIVGATATSMTLSGAVKHKMSGDTKYIPLSLKKPELYGKKDYNEKAISSMDAVYYYDSGENSLERMELHYSGDGHFDIYRENGEMLGSIVEKAQAGTFFEE